MKLKGKTYDVASLRSRFSSPWPFDIEPAHTDAGHFYRRGDTGLVAASVTTKLGFVAKPWIGIWQLKRCIGHVRDNLDRLLAGDLTVLDEATGSGDRFRDNAADIGTRAHDAFDRYLSRWIETGIQPEGSSVEDLNELCRIKNTEPRSEEIAACRSFDKFLGERELIPIASEIRVWYEHKGDVFAGTVDAIFLDLTVYKERTGQEGVVDLSGKAHGRRHDYAYQEGTQTLWCAACDREVTAKLILGDHKTSNSIITHDDYAQQGTAYGHAIEKAVGIKFDEFWVMRYSKERADYEVCRVQNRKQAWQEFVAISRAFDAKRVRESKNLLESITSKEVIHI